MKNLGAQHLVILSILISCSHCQKPILPDLPSPRIVILGPTGAGKSSLANALLGCDPESLDCMFEVCNDMASCTKQTTWGFGPWMGNGQNFTVVDTPGFGDSNGEDEILIEEMMDILANKVDHADTLLLLLDGLAPRFTDSLQTMMQKLTLIFGQIWWDWLVIGVSKWSYSQEAIHGRHCYPELLNHKPACKDEAWFERNINTQMEELFHRNRTFTFVFTDSWAQKEGPPGFNTEDPLQQLHWEEQTDILWDITMNRENVFDFMTIDDILEENARQRAEIKRLNDVIDTDISDLKKRVGNNEDDINGATGIPGLKTRVGNNEDDINDLSITPIGTIIAWVMKPSSDVTDTTDLPDGWMKCNGDTITGGIWQGKLLPNLNGENRFLRGGTDGQVLTLQDDMVLEHSHQHTIAKHSHDVGIHSHDVPDHTHIVPAHSHTIADHAHDVTDPGHSHRYRDKFNGNGSPCSCMGGNDGVETEHLNSDDAFAGITVDTKKLTVDSSTFVLGEGTVTVQDAELDLTDADVTLTIGDVIGLQGEEETRRGKETRPKNMHVIYIMRVW